MEPPVCTLPCQKAFEHSICYLALSPLLLGPPNAQETVVATNEQGVIVGRLIDDVDETVNNRPKTTAVRLGGDST
jgi:hypothetical protein